ncbi:hypothetical protein RQP53_16165 [Paucibacter sp. APW11]|uniref:Uncharacterized protein n=1 Tax=Roseateles aquae TaxID=3077235 RepID=A0ABU3PE32_9BURK|nr:hypothetical protein [Paucibacter sp. APW11]MDT9000813.1 hypothetical protein [Paucibacter sp. APW11]
MDRHSFLKRFGALALSRALPLTWAAAPVSGQPATAGVGSNADLLERLDVQTERWFDNTFRIEIDELNAGLALLAMARHAGMLSSRHIKAAYGVLVAQWLLPEAEQLVAGRPQWRECRLPKLASPRATWPNDGFRLWHINRRGEALLSRLDIAARPRVIISTGLGCGFSARAIREIQADQRLARRLADAAVFLSLPDSALDLSEHAAWIERNKPFDLAFIHRLSDWPMIDRFETPVFFFLRQGVLHDTMIGWPAGGRMRELEQGLAAIGI